MSRARSVLMLRRSANKSAMRPSLRQSTWSLIVRLLPRRTEGGGVRTGGGGKKQPAQWPRGGGGAGIMVPLGYGGPGRGHTPPSGVVGPHPPPHPLLQEREAPLGGWARGGGNGGEQPLVEVVGGGGVGGGGGEEAISGEPSAGLFRRVGK